MTVATDLPSLCGSVQDLTNPDFCGVGVLASYTVGVALVFLHQAGFAIIGCFSERTDRAHHESQVFDPRNHGHTQHPGSDTRPHQFHASINASSVCLFDTAIVLAISWEVAALLSLNSPNLVQTTHDVLLVCLTTYASLAITLGALCTTFDLSRRHKFRIGSCFLSLFLCTFITGIAQHLMVKDDFPKEVCLPFFNEFKPNMRKYFVVLSVVFWVTSMIMVAVLFMPTAASQQAQSGASRTQSHRRFLDFIMRSRLYVVVLVEILLLIIILLVNHYFVPEQVLRAQAGGKLAEGQWSFGQIVGMLIWLPVLTEFTYVFVFGPKEGMEGRLPVPYTVSSQTVTQNHAMPVSRFNSRSTGEGYTMIEVSLHNKPEWQSMTKSNPPHELLDSCPLQHVPAPGA